jgi:protein O-GlcNAc transferase
VLQNVLYYSHEHIWHKGNLAQAEIHLRLAHEAQPENPVILNFLGWIASAVNLPQFAINYFSEASRLSPDWQVPQTNLQKAHEQLRRNEQLKGPSTGEKYDGPEKKHNNKAGNFLLIKAWSYGFWSDVSHVLGQLLVAEITGRTPIVHWDSNSLFGDGTGSNAFEFYFETLSDVDVGDI